ncbi:Pkinase-domain-containing protein [Aspergillus affinis]|uniref:Pkinase-domain-containing protein n=1 Tax=Aspergillus affinis TaxID=1070780 RepID=UPI0022FE65A7|nr:Pkinase-domain-containing protein [Aspergillus affinis]KAI9038735.1 Pkinase-domain-containing protein [Aspergillus affinis]
MATRHPNVVPLIRIMDSPNCTYVVMEFYPEGDLFHGITQKGMYVGNDTLIKLVFVQILDAVHQCHELGVYHFNIQPEHISVADQGNTLKLSSFELATASPYSVAFNYKRKFYASPESLSSKPNSEVYASAPHDIWSLGINLVNLICGCNPWKLASIEDSTYRAYLKDPYFLKAILPLSDEAIVILSRILENNPDERISIPELRGLILGCPCFSTDWRVVSSEPKPVSTLDTMGSPGVGDRVGRSVKGTFRRSLKDKFQKPLYERKKP